MDETFWIADFGLGSNEKPEMMSEQRGREQQLSRNTENQK